MEQVFSEMVERVNTVNKSAMDAAMRFNRLAVRTQGLIARQQLNALETCVEAGTRQMKLVAETRDPKELMAKQAEVAAELGERLFSLVQESLDIQAQARDELSAWFEEGLKAAATEAEQSVAKAAKATKAAKPVQKAA